MLPEVKMIWKADQGFRPLPGTDHIDFFAGNAKQSAHCVRRSGDRTYLKR